MSEGVSKMETSIVKFFDSRDNKRFGFLKLESGDEIFFHLSDGRMVTLGVGEPCMDYYNGSLSRVPRVGDAILFNRDQGRKGPKACPWVFKDEFERMSAESAKNVKEPSLVTTNQGMEYTCYKDGKVMTYKVGASYIEALGVPAPNFEAPSYSHCGITSQKSLEEMFRFPIPEEMKQELRNRLSAYQNSVEERRPRLCELLRSILGDVDVRLEDYEKYLADLFEQDQIDKQEGGSTKDRKQKKMLRHIRVSMILEKYWKSKTSRDRLNFYPGNDSGGGFLGWGEVLETVIKEDTEKLLMLGYDHRTVGLKLKEVLEKKSERHEVETQAWLGYQHCPFKGCEWVKKICFASCVDFTITNRTSGEQIKGPGFVWHLIADHNFFEGKGTLYRVDPEQLIKVLFG